MNSPAQSETSEQLRISPTTVGSFILLSSFFFPWIKFWAGTAAGYELRQIWGPGLWLWAIPLASGWAIFWGLSGKRNVGAGQIAGGLPFVFLVIALFQYGGDVFKALQFGGYLTLLTGLFLVVVAPRVGRKEDETPLEAKKSTANIPHEAEDNR